MQPAPEIESARRVKLPLDVAMVMITEDSDQRDASQTLASSYRESRETLLIVVIYILCFVVPTAS